MKLPNIKQLRCVLAVAWIGVSLVLVGCDGGEASYAPAPAENASSQDFNDVAPVGDFGTVKSVKTNDGFGKTPNVSPIGSVNNQRTKTSVLANGKASVTIKHRTAAAFIKLPGDDSRPETTLPSLNPSNEFTSLFEEIDRKLASLPLANIAFNTPETIPYGDAAQIELLVSLQETEEKLRQAIQSVGPVQTARVKVSPYLEASLAGVGFRIEPVTPPRQLLSSTERTQWRWNLEPTKAEPLELTLTLSAIFMVDGQQSTRAIQTFSRTIAVNVPVTHRLSSFVTANQDWLITMLLFPVGAWLYRRYIKRGKTPPSDNQDEQPAISRAA